MCWHKWSLWSKPYTVTMYFVHLEKEFTIYRQERCCTKCWKVQYRTVKDT